MSGPASILVLGIGNLLWADEGFGVRCAEALAERDKYHANDVRPGLTGWAQIHGRDELEIAEKAKLDGWYVEHLSFGLDVKCFFGTIAAVLKHDGVVEGGTGTLHEEEKRDH